MVHFIRHWFRSQAHVSASRRACSVEVGFLEGRLLLSGAMAAPTTTIQISPNSLNSTGYYTTSPETVRLIASDPASPNGLETFYSVDHSKFVEGNTLQLGNGIHTLQFFSENQSGVKGAIETRIIKIDSTVPVVTASANPTSLWPPNGKMVAVTVTGHVSDAWGRVPSIVRYHVIDEFGEVQPSGVAAVNRNGNYSFVVDLQSSRLGQDKNGRQYTIVVTATNEADNTGSARTYVVVPHDQGNHGGNAQAASNGNDNSQGNENGNGHGKAKGHG